MKLNTFYGFYMKKRKSTNCELLMKHKNKNRFFFFFRLFNQQTRLANKIVDPIHRYAKEIDTHTGTRKQNSLLLKLY